MSEIGLLRTNQQSMSIQIGIHPEIVPASARSLIYNALSALLERGSSFGRVGIIPFSVPVPVPVPVPCRAVSRLVGHNPNEHATSNT
ncbi:hypothetical protein E4U10_005408 [Claviceps purpurea]|nr:hypothetical protein E4U10_005408 [Claviceps purpurea]